MFKLLDAFRRNPTDTNKARLQKHLNKRPMTACFLDAADTAFLRLNGFKL